MSGALLINAQPLVANDNNQSLRPANVLQFIFIEYPGQECISLGTFICVYKALVLEILNYFVKITFTPKL